MDNEINNTLKNIAIFNNILRLKRSVISKYSQQSLIIIPLKIIANIKHMILNISATVINHYLFKLNITITINNVILGLANN